jgi:hypothetical protein
VSKLSEHSVVEKYLKEQARIEAAKKEKSRQLANAIAPLLDAAKRHMGAPITHREMMKRR